MNKPQLPIRIATTIPVSAEQTLTLLCQLVPGAVVLSPNDEQPCLARLRDFLVKNVRISPFTSFFTEVFTLSPPKILRQRNIQSRNFKSDGRKTTKTGGSDPTFSAFSRPKSSWGCSRPPRAARGHVLSAQEKGTSAFVRQHV
jgi:hypothetical protein